MHNRDRLKVMQLPFFLPDQTGAATSVANGQDRSEIRFIPNALLESDPANFLRVSIEFLADEVRKLPEGTDCGSTLTAAVITGRTITVANIGDSRAILITKKDGVYQSRNLTHDHKAGYCDPENPALPPQMNVEDQQFYLDECRRIYREGGSIKTGADGTKRLDGCLAITRAFGDRRLPGISDKADITQFILPPDATGYLLLATDGLTDIVTLADIDRILNASKKLPSCPNPAYYIAEKLCSVAKSTPVERPDDTTIVVSALPHVSQEPLLCLVCDGHGNRMEGHIIADYIKDNLPKILLLNKAAMLECAPAEPTVARPASPHRALSMFTESSSLLASAGDIEEEDLEQEITKGNSL